MTSAAQRLSALKAKLNEAREENLQAVEDESKNRSNAAATYTQTPDQQGAHSQSLTSKSKSRKRQRPNYDGFEIDSADEAQGENDDDRLRSMKRRSRKLNVEVNCKSKDAQREAVIEYGKTGQKVTEEGVRRMVEELRDTEKRRDKFQRRRAFDEDRVDINFINEGNRAFNRRLDRHFDKFESVRKIKDNLERGTG